MKIEIRCRSHETEFTPFLLRNIGGENVFTNESRIPVLSCVLNSSCFVTQDNLTIYAKQIPYKYCLQGQMLKTKKRTCKGWVREINERVKIIKQVKSIKIL